jgi:hypothetical protein
MKRASTHLDADGYASAGIRVLSSRTKNGTQRARKDKPGTAGVSTRAPARATTSTAIATIPGDSPPSVPDESVLFTPIDDFVEESIPIPSKGKPIRASRSVSVRDLAPFSCD